jgi:hypothetical protein
MATDPELLPVLYRWITQVFPVDPAMAIRMLAANHRGLSEAQMWEIVRQFDEYVKEPQK